MLSVSKVTRFFGGLCAVNEVSFEIQTGEIFGLIGPNGAGKTTLFNLITGLTELSAGQVLFENVRISGFDKVSLPFYEWNRFQGMKPHQIAQQGIARTFQNIRLFGNLTALENVMVSQHVHTHSGLLTGIIGTPRSRQEEQHVKEKAMDLLTLVHLGDKWDEQAKNFSYGDQRRLEIARALALEPRLLLLDEPGAGMNTYEKSALSDFIRQIREQFHLTVLLIEHHVPLVMGLCDRIAVLNFGQLIALGTPESVQNDPAVIEAYLGDS